MGLIEAHSAYLHCCSAFRISHACKAVCMLAFAAFHCVSNCGSGEILSRITKRLRAKCSRNFALDFLIAARITKSTPGSLHCMELRPSNLSAFLQKYNRLKLTLQAHYFCGSGEIRTLGTLRYAAFPRRCTRPLCDASVYATVYSKKAKNLPHDRIKHYATMHPYKLAPYLCRSYYFPSQS